MNTLTDHVRKQSLQLLHGSSPGGIDARKQLWNMSLQVEEKELDTAKVSKAMTEINASQKAAREAQRQR